MAVCPLPLLDEQTNELSDKRKAHIEELQRMRLHGKIYDIIANYKEDLAHPGLKADVVAQAAQYQAELAALSMRTESDKYYNNQHIEKSIKEFNVEMQDYVMAHHQDGGLGPGFQGSLLRFMNKMYKGTTVGMAMGRFVNETINVATTSLASKLSHGVTAFNDKTFVLSTLGYDKTYSLPEPGRLDKQSFTGNLDYKDVAGGKTFLDSIANVFKPFWAIQRKTMDPISNYFQQGVYSREFYEAYKKLARKVGGNPTGELINSKNEFLFKENITGENKAKKFNLIQEAKRNARESALQIFLDYKNNPLLVKKMENFIPFSNFMYSGIQLLGKYPKTFMIMASALQNYMQTYGENSWYLDDDGDRIDAGLSFRMPILAGLGLGSVGINLNRMMQISPTTIGLSPSPIFSFLTNREDYRWKDFYTKGDEASLQKVAISMMGPTIQQLFEGFHDLDKPIKPGEKNDALAKITQAVAYVTTGMVIKDKSQAQAWKWYIEGDYDNLLSLSQLQLNQFFKHPTNVNKGITVDSIRGAKLQKEIFGSKKWEENPQTTILHALIGLGLAENVVTPKEFNLDIKNISNLVEFTAGSVKEGGDLDPEFYDKCKAFSKSSYFKSFEKFNPTLYKSYKHFADNYDWYKAKDKAYEKAFKGATQDEKNMGWATVLALKYQFEGTERMSTDEIARGLVNGQIKTPIIVEQDIEGGLPPGPKMTRGFYNSLDHKGSAMLTYLHKANAVLAYENMRKMFSGLAASIQDKDDSKKYWDIANNLFDKEKEAREKFELTKTNEWELYSLSDSNFSFQKAMKSKEEYLENSKKWRSGRESWKFDKMGEMSNDEKSFYKNVFGTNMDAKSKQTLSSILSDAGNPYYSQQITNKENFQNILNSLNHGK